MDKHFCMVEDDYHHYKMYLEKKVFLSLFTIFLLAIIKFHLEKNWKGTSLVP